MTKQGGWGPTDFGLRLRELREAVGLSQLELAESAGCHAMTISKLERGTAEPAWPLVLKLAEVLCVPCTAFTGDPAPIAKPRGRGRPKRG